MQREIVEVSFTSGYNKDDSDDDDDDQHHHHRHHIFIFSRGKDQQWHQDYALADENDGFKADDGGTDADGTWLCNEA